MNVAVLLLAASALPSAARAYEDQLSFGVGAGYAYATQAGASDHGAYFQLEASLGVSPTWSLRGVLGYGEHPATLRLSQGLLGVEALYLVDVLELVPYAGVGIDGLASITAADTHFAFGAHPVLGIDWLLGRSFLLGLCARPIFVLSELERGPLYLTVSLTAAWLLDL
ncbi:MAG TPA: hypothetical protein VMF89_30205 [Polyangiales bacterium]|nr:hypothetical protein [Polyangiales bacterium]